MKCLSIRQPWAWCITHGSKRYENRNWRCRYRGPLLIHAGKSRDELTLQVWDQLRRLGIDLPKENGLVFGAIVGRCVLADCVRPEQTGYDAWARGPWCLRLDDVRALRVPVPCRGMRGLFEASALADL